MGRGGGHGGHHGGRSHVSHSRRSHTTYHSRSRTTHHYTSTYHGSSTTTYHSSSGGSNPKVMGVCCAFLAILFLILAIVIPVVIIVGFVNPCSNINNLNRNEQAFCEPTDLTKTWTAEYYSKGSGYAKVYRLSADSLVTTYRGYSWLNYQEHLYYEHTYFTVACPLGVEVSLYLRTNERYKLKFYWLTKNQYKSALDDGYFRESRYMEEVFTYNGDGVYYWHTTSSTKDTLYYMVFSANSYSVSFDYDVIVNYKIYDVSSKNQETCSGTKCSFNDMKTGEVIILDFPSSTTSSSESTSEPPYFDISLHDNSINWSAAGTFLGVFLLFFLVFAALSILFLFKYVKKAGKKVASAVDKASDSVSTPSSSTTDNSKVTQMTEMSATPSASVQATPAGDPNYAAAPPYPVYSAQPYPTGDPNYAAAQPYPGQPYPGQPYPGQPYPVQPYPDQPNPDGVPPQSDQPM